MRAQRQLEEIKRSIKTIERMAKQPTTDKLNAYMGAALKEVELSRHLSFGQKNMLNGLIERVYDECREKAIDTDVVIDSAPAGILEILFA